MWICRDLELISPTHLFKNVPFHCFNAINRVLRVRTKHPDPFIHFVLKGFSQQVLLPVGDVAVADALHVSEAGAAQQPVLAGVQRQQQVAHPVGVMDGLAEHRALLLLHALRLHVLAERRPQPALLRRQLQRAHHLPAPILLLL